MRRDDERALYGLADDDDRPDPANARTPAEFVALLGALVEHSGLSLPEIEELAGSKGYVLPEQIIATALSHDALPPEELVVALVRSIGINDREVKYWVEVLWRLESRPTYDPSQAKQDYARQPPRDIDQIYGAKDEAGPAQPYVVPAPYDVAQVPEGDELYEEPYSVPMFVEVGHVPDVDERRELPKRNGAGQPAAVDEVYEAEADPDEDEEYDEPHVEPEPVSTAAFQDFSGGPLVRAVSERGRHRRDDDDDDEVFLPDNIPYVQHYEPPDSWVLRPERPRVVDFTTRSIRRVRQKATWPVPVAVGLSLVIAVSGGAWMAFGGNGGEGPRNAVGAPPGTTASTANQTGTASTATEATATPTTVDGSPTTAAVAVIPGNGQHPPGNPNNPNPLPTTQGPPPPPVTTPPGSYNTQLSGNGSTTCTNDGGQWRVRIIVNVTVSDPPPGLVPQGQAGLSGSMQGFSLSGGGTSYSGTASVLVGPSSSPSVGTVQWLVTLSVPGGRTARDESFEGFSCA